MHRQHLRVLRIELPNTKEAFFDVVRSLGTSMMSDEEEKDE